MLTFDGFQAVNEGRSTSPNGFNHKLESWSYLEWAGAMAGEAGEACNKAKKLIRIRDAVSGNKVDETEEGLKAALIEETVDTITYAFLILSKCGVRAEDAIREKFNEKSDELGCVFKI